MDFSGAVFSYHTDYDGLDVRGTDLSKTKGLDKRYYSEMRGDHLTKLPKRLPIPDAWLAEDTPDTAAPLLPDTPIGHGLTADGDALTLEPGGSPLEASALAGLFEDLQDAVEDIRDLGHLDNHTPMLVKGIERFLRRLPDQISDLDEVRFGTNAQALSIQYAREKSALEEIAPEKLGHLDAALLRANLIAANLPLWQVFRAAEAPFEPIVDAKREDMEAILEHAAEALENDPQHFDPSLFERIREYLDDATIIAYLAAKDLLLGIAHKTFTLAHSLAKDTLTEARKVAIKGIAGALLAQLGTVLGNLVGVFPRELFWLSDWLRYLPSLLS